MEGKLVEQARTDPPASQLLKEIEAEKKRLVKEGKIKAPKPLPEIKPEEVPYALPQGWEWVRLGGISEYIQRGKGPTYSEIQEIPVISQKCIQWDGFNKSVVRFIDPSTLDAYQNERLVRNGDLLWNSTGTGTIGRVNLYADELSEFPHVVADSHVTVVRLIGLCNSFVLSYLMSPAIQSRIEENASGTTNQIELNTTTVINQIVPLPPLPEQHRIVAKIDQLMARCDELEKLRDEREQKRRSVHTAALKQLLDVQAGDSFADAWQFITQHFGELYAVRGNVTELRKAILQLAVMGKLVPQNPNDPPASQLLKEIEAEKKRLVKAGKIKAPKPLPEIKSEDVPYALPKGWEWVHFEEIVDIGSGITKGRHLAGRKTVFVPYLRVANVQRGYLDLREIKEIEIPDNEVEKLQLKTGDLLITEGGDWDKVGRTSIWRSEIPLCAHQNHIFKARKILDRQNEIWLETYMNANTARAYFAGASKQTTNLASINKTQLRGCPIPIPPLPEQNRIVTKLDSLMSLCDTLEQQIDAATRQQTTLLDAVMAQV